MRCWSACRASPRPSWSTTLGTVLGLDSNRIQFTPDLMPSDILGSEVLDQDEAGGAARSASSKGPIFTQLADGRRDQPRLAAHPVGAAAGDAGVSCHRGRRTPRPAAPFHVLATQNPLEQEGTYPLPEAQLDRFLMQVDVPYPEMAAERRILLETTGHEPKPRRGRHHHGTADAEIQAADPPHAGARKRRRRDPRTGPRRPSRPWQRPGRRNMYPGAPARAPARQ
jgi:hypothetical protein